uniref:Uncharacterized protein n=1 Tax=Arundo donax TaxID=35708 RepID=A0A0A8Y230_ARUDO
MCKGLHIVKRNIRKLNSMHFSHIGFTLNALESSRINKY